MVIKAGEIKSDNQNRGTDTPDSTMKPEQALEDNHVLHAQDQKMLDLFNLIEGFVTPVIKDSPYSVMTDTSFLGTDLGDNDVFRHKAITLPTGFESEFYAVSGFNPLMAQGGLTKNADGIFSSIGSRAIIDHNPLQIIEFTLRGGEAESVTPTAPTIPAVIGLASTVNDDVLIGGIDDDLVDLSIVGGTDTVTTNAGDDTVTSNSNVRNTTINTGSGEDTINLDGSLSGLNIDTGDDTDNIALTSISNSNIDAGAGDDNVVINSVLQGSTLNVGAGNDEVTINGFGGFFSTVNTGDGNDTVTISVAETSNINTGIGNDTITINIARFSSIINSGDGEDVIDILNKIVHQSEIHGGEGNDIINVADEIDFDSYIYGGDGDDVINVSGAIDSDSEIHGDDGNDTLNVFNGNGTKEGVFGDAGADTFLFTGIGGTASIDDFSVGDNDIIDISGLLIGYDPLSDILSDFVRFADNGADLRISIDANGGGDSFSNLVTVIGNAGLDADTLETSGHLDTVI